MLGPETVHAVAKDILQGMPYEEAVMLLGWLQMSAEPCAKIYSCGFSLPFKW